jgi:hypothetical protein
MDPSPEVSEGSARPRQAESAVFLAIVHADDGVRFMAATGFRRELVHRVADYVRERCDDMLSPEHACHLHGLLVRRETEAAVELYFAVVGSRWDKEWLVTAFVPSDTGLVTGALGCIASCRARAESRRCSSNQEAGPRVNDSMR